MKANDICKYLSLLKARDAYYFDIFGLGELYPEKLNRMQLEDNIEWKLKADISYNDSYSNWHYIVIGKYKDGWVKHEHVPGGYSEYTYEPDLSTQFYNDNFDKFWSLCLTEDERQAIIKSIRGI
jgi:hypothetical protein